MSIFNQVFSLALNFSRAISARAIILGFCKDLEEKRPNSPLMLPFDKLCNICIKLGYRGLTGGFLLLQNFSAAISVSPHVCFILVLILISMFLR